MTKPARQTHQAQIFALQRRELWGVLLLMLLGLVVGLALGEPVLITKSMAVGSLLAYVAQTAFTLIAYRLTGTKTRQSIVLYLYLGQMIKWVMTLAGFALIFIWITPINAMVVLLGYLFMQVGHNVMMWRLKL